MKIAILHHHLNRGGVTQVVLNHVRALQICDPEAQPTRILVLHGGRAEGWRPDEEFPAVPVEVAVVEGLDYEDGRELRQDKLSQAIAGALDAAGCGPDETILHVHNHSLGKSVSLPGALRQLAQRGYRLLLQIHDFAEDWRPANYVHVRRVLEHAGIADLGTYLYPMAPHIHYALLNHRDQAILRSTEIDAAQVHLLPNPVTGTAALPPRKEALRRFRTAHGLNDSQRIVVYPVRGIRRKNLGELLLWSVIADPQTTFALTLPATSEEEVPAFERWRKLAEQLQLRVLFDVGLCPGMSFADNLAAADRIITTSVAEGFGLAFLECWLHDRLLIGRNLPEITADFGSRGVSLNHLGTEVAIPLAWIGIERFVSEALALQRRFCTAYGRSMPANCEAELRERIAAGNVDFAALTTEQQTSVIQRAAEDPAAAAGIRALNPWMQHTLEGAPTRWDALIHDNAAAVRAAFSLATTAEDLTSIYGTLFASSAGRVGSLPQPQNILNAFLDIRRQCPVRIEP